MTSKEAKAFMELAHAISDLDQPPPCSDKQNIDLFYPNPLVGVSIHESDFRLRVTDRMAKVICDPCPVKQLCASYALIAGEQWGVWGGLTVNDRRSLTRSKKGMNGQQPDN